MCSRYSHLSALTSISFSSFPYISLSFLPLLLSVLVVKLFQSYVDPEQSPVTAGETEEVALPLDPNVLTCNLGIPLIVVCAKVGNGGIVDMLL